MLNSIHRPRLRLLLVRTCVLAMLLPLTGCGVILAASSPKEPDLSVVRVGAHRSEVETQLGKPIEFVRKWGGDETTYMYLGADEVDYKRAATYAFFDAFTLGAVELIAAPIETLQNDQHILKVTYDVRGRVKKIAHTVKKAPLEKPQKLLGIDKPQAA